MAGDAEAHACAGAPCRPARRQFVAALAAASTATLLADRGVGGASAQPAPIERGAIDVHHHVFPPAFLKATESYPIGASRTRMVEWSASRSIAEMDAAGIATAVASITNPGIWLGNPDAASALSRECNEFQAKLARDHSTRFGFFAAIPLPNSRASLREIEHALDILKADGIGLMTNYGDKWPGDPAFAEVFDELNRRKAVVYLHPIAADCCRQLMPGIPDPLVEFPHDTTRAIVSLLYSGTLSRCPDIRFVVSHAGGTIPMLAGRLNETGALFGIDKRLPNGVEFELRRLHYDIANAAHRPVLSALTNLVPTSQILFGTDYPFLPARATSGRLGDFGLSTGELQAIRRENALALFPRMRVPG